MKHALESASRLVAVVLSVVAVIPSRSALSQGGPIVGYGSSDAVLPAKNQELFYMGFELALRSVLDQRFGHDALTVEQVSDGSQLGAIRAAKALVGRGAKMLVGFPTSHEALLAADIAIKAPMLMIASGAGHEKLSNMGNYVFTTGESMDYSVRTMMEFIGGRYGKAKGLLVANPRAIFSVNLADTARRLQADSQKKLLPELEYAEVDAKLTLPAEALQKLKRGEYKYVFLTQYADESARLLQQLEDLSIDVPIFSNSSWTTGDMELLRRLMIRRKSETYSCALWMPESSESRPFERLVRKIYGREPTSEMAYGYDVGLIVAKTLSSVKGELTRENIHQAFLTQKCFTGLTSGKLCFHPKGGNADRKIYFVKFVKDRFVPVHPTSGKPNGKN